MEHAATHDEPQQLNDGSDQVIDSKLGDASRPIGAKLTKSEDLEKPQDPELPIGARNSKLSELEVPKESALPIGARTAKPSELETPRPNESEASFAAEKGQGAGQPESWRHSKRLGGWDNQSTTTLRPKSSSRGRGHSRSRERRKEERKGDGDEGRKAGRRSPRRSRSRRSRSRRSRSRRSRSHRQGRRLPRRRSPRRSRSRRPNWRRERNDERGKDSRPKAEEAPAEPAPEAKTPTGKGRGKKGIEALEQWRREPAAKPKGGQQESPALNPSMGFSAMMQQAAAQAMGAMALQGFMQFPNMAAAPVTMPAAVPPAAVPPAPTMQVPQMPQLPQVPQVPQTLNEPAADPNRVRITKERAVQILNEFRQVLADGENLLEQYREEGSLAIQPQASSEEIVADFQAGAIPIEDRKPEGPQAEAAPEEAAPAEAAPAEAAPEEAAPAAPEEAVTAEAAPEVQEAGADAADEQIVAVQEPQALQAVSRYEIHGFKNPELNGIYAINENPDAIVNGRATYWKGKKGELGSIFMCWSNEKSRWHISPQFASEDLFRVVHRGGDRGVAVSTEEERIWLELWNGQWDEVELHIGCEMEENGVLKFVPDASSIPEHIQAQMRQGSQTRQQESAPEGQPSQGVAISEVEVGHEDRDVQAMDMNVPEDTSGQVDMEQLKLPEHLRRKPITRRIVEYDTPSWEETRSGNQYQSSQMEEEVQGVNNWSKGSGKGQDLVERMPDWPGVERDDDKTKVSAASKKGKEEDSDEPGAKGSRSKGKKKEKKKEKEKEKEKRTQKTEKTKTKNEKDRTPKAKAKNKKRKD
ncbi:unnamed protein product [Durusdinium trenchii]|uniref:Uncharacterized protein n=2 Tax=Durusdinium trenchii TaxID=1381693 RepID=A0ABP0NTQ2_9DINO